MAQSSEIKLLKRFDQNVEITGNLTVSGTLTGGADTNYYLDGITKSGNTLTFSVNGATNQTYTFGSAAFANTTDFAAASHTHSYLPLSGGNLSGNLNIIKNNVGVITNYSAASIEANDAQLDIISSSAGTWGSAINLVEGTSSTANTNVWSIARQTSGVGNLLRFNFGTGNQHDNPAMMSLSTGGNLTLTGTLSASGYNKSNWDTAYGWGNHASAGYLTSAREDNGGELPSTTDLNTLIDNGLYGQNSNSQALSTSNYPGGGGFAGILEVLNDPGNTYHTSQMYFRYNGNNDIFHRYRYDTSGGNGGWSDWAKIWTSRTDGSGSGLDADLLDGNHASAFALTAHNHDGTYVKEGGTSFNGEYPVVVRTGADTIYSDGNIRFRGSDSAFFVDGSISAPIFYDSNDANYYLNPASTGISFYTQGRISQINQSNSTWPYLFVTSSVGNDNHSGFWVGSNGYPDMRLRRENSTVRAKISSWERSYTTFGFTDSTDMRSPIFYDSDNTGYYLNPASASNLNDVTASAFIGPLYREDNRVISPSELGSGRMRFGFGSFGNNNTSPWSSHLHMRSYTDSSGGNDLLLVFKKANPSKVRLYSQTYGSSTAYSSYIDLIDTSTDDQVKSGYFQSNESLRAPIFYDSNNTSYYCDPASTSNLNNLTVNGTLYAAGSNQLDYNFVRVYENQNYVASSTSTSNRGNFGKGITAYEGYSTGTNRPHTYDATLQVMPNAASGFELSVDWVSQTKTPLKIRSLRDCCQGWSEWREVMTAEHSHSGNFTTTGNMSANNLYVSNAIFHNGDTNTYLQFHNNDQFRVVIAGGEVTEWGANYMKMSDNDVIRLGSGSDFRMWHDGTHTYFRNYNHAGGNMYWVGEDTEGTNHALLYMITNVSEPYVRLFANGSERLSTYTGGCKLTGTLRINDSNTYINEGSGNAVRIGTSSGYVDIGPQNTSWCHFQTDRGGNYFNKKVIVDSGTIGSYDEDLSLVRANSTADRILIRATSIGFFLDSAEDMRLENDGDLHVEGDVIAYSSTISDKRLKDDVETIPNALDKVKALRGVEYTWNKGHREGQRDLGLIAQEVEQVLPEIVREKKMPLMDDSEEKYKTVDYEKVVGVLVEAIKEQQKQIDELKSLINKS